MKNYCFISDFSSTLPSTVRLISLKVCFFFMRIKKFLQQDCLGSLLSLTGIRMMHNLVHELRFLIWIPRMITQFNLRLNPIYQKNLREKSAKNQKLFAFRKHR